MKSADVQAVILKCQDIADKVEPHSPLTPDQRFQILLLLLRLKLEKEFLDLDP